MKGKKSGNRVLGYSYCLSPISLYSFLPSLLYSFYFNFVVVLDLGNFAVLVYFAGFSVCIDCCLVFSLCSWISRYLFGDNTALVIAGI